MLLARGVAVVGVDKTEITGLLKAWSRGDQDALERLVPRVLGELRRLARASLRREKDRDVLQSTALINEAYLRLVEQGSVDWKDRAHFFGVAARLMRQILVDAARARQAQKRGGDRTFVELDEAVVGDGSRRRVDVIALDAALERLGKLEPRLLKLVELRFFSGLTVREAAEVLGVHRATANRDWQMAKAWLYGEMTRS